MQALVSISGTTILGESDTTLAATLGQPAMLAQNGPMASNSSATSDEFSPTLQHSVHEGGRSSRAAPSSATLFLSYQSPNLSKPALKSSAQAPKIQVGTRKSSPLQQSDSAETVKTNINSFSPLSPAGRSPRERLEALLASESSISSRSSAGLPYKYTESSSTIQPHAAVLRNVSAPLLATSPPTSPPPQSMLPSRLDSRPAMARNNSIDSEVSSVSSKMNEPLRSPTHNKALESGPSAPADVAGLITAAGSAEAALFKLWKEKQGADSHNAQLWRLVEKQRAMILGLNKDLEKAVKDRDRYRKKLKEVTQNASGATAVHRTDSALDRQEKEKPGAAIISPTERPAAEARPEVVSPVVRSPTDGLMAPLRRQATDTISLPESTSEVTSIEPYPVTSTTQVLTSPRDNIVGTPLDSPENSQGEFEKDMDKFPVPASNNPIPSPKPPLSPPFTPPSAGPTVSVTEPTPMLDSGKFSPRSSKLMRKGAPAPLNLAQPTRSAPLPPSEMTAGDASARTLVEPEMSPEVEAIERGRRRTREDDDRIREAYVVAQEEARSLSKKSKSGKSKSKSKGPSEQPQIQEPNMATTPSPRATGGLPPSPRPTQVTPQLSNMLSPAGSESSMGSMAAHRSNIPTPLLSPGLPMSPRPGDRPMHAPSPRFPKQMVFPTPGQQASPSSHLGVSEDEDRYSAMSPSALPAPLFAKAPSQGLPPSPKLPPQGLPPSPKILLDREVGTDSPTSSQSHSIPTTPGSPLPANVFKGLMSEQYPNLLLPPNALPLIDVKVFSSRLRPSRHSLLLANPMEEDPVFLLGIYSRSSGKQLWRVEKTIHSLPVLHQGVRSACDFDGKLPEKHLFSGHAPAKIDARRAALNAYFDLLLDTELSEKAALAVCEFFSSNVMSAEEEPAPKPTRLTVPGMAPPVATSVPSHKEGYLTKRGKNFGGWKARYFVLDGPELKYYDTQNGPQIGVIKLYKAQIGKQSQAASHDATGKEEEADNQYRHAFLVLEPKRKDSSSLVRHVLCAESDEERDAWVAALLKWVEKKDGKAGSQSDARMSRMHDPVTPKPKRRAPSRPERGDEFGKEADIGDVEHGEQLVQGTNYEDTVAGELPIQGTTASSYGGSRGMASPPLTGNFNGMLAPPQNNARNTMLISGPSNGSVIQNTENWGMKTPVKEKKRSIFGFHRARTPSDTTSGQSSTSSSILAADRRAPLLRPVFGMPLAEAVDSAPPHGVDVHLPAVVYRCIEYLEAQGAAKEEGIFRLSGSQTVIKGLRERFNNDGDVRLLDGSYYDVHAVASLLKLYLRELPSSVLTRDFHLDFLKSLEIEDRDRKISAINVLVHLLPRANFELLSNLCSYLADIANASDINKMNVRNGKFTTYP